MFTNVLSRNTSWEPNRHGTRVVRVGRSFILSEAVRGAKLSLLSQNPVLGYAGVGAKLNGVRRIFPLGSVCHGVDDSLSSRN
jgi:hypothetical protein